MSNDLVKEFHMSLARMIDLKCWNASCVVWGALCLRFGEVFVKNETTPGGKEFTYEAGEWNILHWCPWRLEEKGIVKCSSHPEFSNSVRELDLLIGDRIVKIEVYLRCYDAIFYFASGKILRVFSDHLQSSKNLSSWDFYNVTDSFYLGPEDEIQKSSEDGRLTQKNYSSEASYDEIAISNTINKQTALIQGDEQFYKDDNFIKKHELNDILGFVCAYVDLLNDEDLLLYLENADPETPVSFRLLISHSAWRLSQDDAFLCSSDNDNSIQQQGLKRIRNDSIVDVLNTNHENDIELNFLSGTTLRIFNLLKDFPLTFVLYNR